MITKPATIKWALTSRDVLDEYDEDRRYLGMSGIGQCPRRLYNEMVNGRSKPSRKTLQYCHEGYLHEWDIKARLQKAGYRVGFDGAEIVAPFDDRHRGHIDGYIPSADLLLEVKSVNRFGFDKIRSAPASYHVDQVQAYMHYSDYWRCLIVYKNRVNGDLWVHIVHEDRLHGAKLEKKARQILAAVDAGVPPECSCGRCKLQERQ